MVFTSLKETAWAAGILTVVPQDMKLNKSYFSEIEKVRVDYVTFGRGKKDRIIEKGLSSVEGLPELEDVLLVEGLVISISQLCDNGMKDDFNKETCCVKNSSD
ncbi:hypothetical protein LIER_42120 [Lithospermum erythrorhizon]|uniref:Uncharacterized protein n=1 Tax=Lithospermum erythrorhizon TaxID=34254 RepID=A0AAV3RNH6_LITER